MDEHSLIKKAFEKDIGKRVVSIIKCENQIFNINNIYRVETENKRYIFKLYRSADYPEKGKATFVSRLLTEHRIPHAKIFSYNRYDADFPNGYIIEECLTGITADKLELTVNETCNVYRNLALMMSEIHKIKLTGYGFFMDTTPDCTTFTEHIESNFIYGKSKMQKFYSDEELNRIKYVLVERLKSCDNIQPCLCHNDIQLKNILVNSKDVILIDWDDARSFPAVVDIARLTLLIELANDNEKAEDIENVEVYRKAFIDNYYFSDGISVYNELESALHIWHGLVILNFCDSSKAQFYKTKTIIDNKLKSL